MATTGLPRFRGPCGAINRHASTCRALPQS